jgi:hypothetical protein
MKQQHQQRLDSSSFINNNAIFKANRDETTEQLNTLPPQPTYLADPNQPDTATAYDQGAAYKQPQLAPLLSPTVSIFQQYFYYYLGQLNELAAAYLAPY